MFTNPSQKITLPLDIGNDEAREMAFLSSLAKVEYEHEAEGQLAVDVAQTADELIITTAMAGTSPDKIELHLHNDLLTIRGFRNSPLPKDAEFFCQECYWGKFSRTIVLPVDIKYELVQAQYKNGVLTIHLPKKQVNNDIPILVVEE